MARVSVVVPIYNVQGYLRQCLDSLAKQSLEDIEIICVNDGSTDSSLDITMEYVNSDSRFKVIDKANSGYGNTVNMGFDLASGEYIGIVESDDFVEPHMLERLYSCAKENSLDVCKGGFYYYYSAPQERKIPCVIAPNYLYDKVFCPSQDLKSLKKKIALFNIKPTVWSAIYKSDFIKQSGIRFTETPGASFQDTAFSFKVWAAAKRVMLLKECLLCYRQDNEASSINSDAKVFSVCYEYKEVERFLKEKGLEDGDLTVVKNVLKFNAYLWNYGRLNEERAKEFILQVSKELKDDMSEGKCPKKAFSWHKHRRLKFIISDPLAFHERRQLEKSEERPTTEADEQGGTLRRWVRRLRKNGIRYTVKSFFRKLK